MKKSSQILTRKNDYKFQGYQCFCGQNFIQKSLLRQHCMRFHEIDLQIQNGAVFSKFVKDGRVSLHLRKQLFRQKIKISEEQCQNKKLEQSETLAEQKKLQKSAASFQQQKSESQNPLGNERSDTIEKITHIFKQYLQMIQKFDPFSYNDEQILINLLTDCIAFKYEDMKRIFFENEEIMSKDKIDQVECLPAIFNFFVSDYLPYILFQKQNEKSISLRSTKFKQKQNQIVFLGHLSCWLKLKNYCSSSVYLVKGAQQLYQKSKI